MSRFELLAASLSVALMVGTKLTGFVALPLLLAVVVVAHRGRALLAPVAAIVAGSALGATWNVMNLVKVGDPSGGFSSHLVNSDVAAAAARAARLLLSFADYPGAIGANKLLYLGVGIIAAAVCAYFSPSHQPPRKCPCGVSYFNRRDPDRAA